MSIRFADAARLESRFVRDGRELEKGLQGTRLQLVQGWLAEIEGKVDVNSLAMLSRYVRSNHSDRVAHLALGAINFIRGELENDSETARFAATFALRRLRSLAGEAPLWRGVELSEKTRRDAEALFAAARGDESFEDDELVATAREFVDQHGHAGHLFGKLASGLSLLVETLLDPEADDDHCETARAALTYLAEVTDAIPDDLGPVGFLDDALVVQQAIAEIYPQRGELKAVLDQVAQEWPFTVDLCFGGAEEGYPASEFVMLNAALLLSQVLDEETRGSALLLSEAGPLPFVMAFMRALAEVRDKLDTEAVPVFRPGERLKSREGRGEAVFVSYCLTRDGGFTYEECTPEVASHFELLVPGKKGARIKNWRAIEDIGSLRRARVSEGDLRGGRVPLGVGNMPLGAIERIFGLVKPAVIRADRGRVLLVAPVGASRRLASSLTVFGTALKDVIPMGQQIMEGNEFKEVRWTSTGPGGSSVLSIVGTTSEALELVESGDHSVIAVVAPIRPESNDAPNLDGIASCGCQVLGILQDGDVDNSEFLSRRGFGFWMWDDEWLANLDWPAWSEDEGVLPLSDFEYGLRHRSEARLVPKVLDLPGLDEALRAAGEIEGIAKSQDSEPLHGLVGEFFGVLVGICRMLAPPESDSWTSLRAAVNRLRERAEGGRQWWTDDVLDLFDTLFGATEETLSFLEGCNPKFEALTAWLAENPKGAVVARRAERQMFERLEDPPEVRWVERVAVGMGGEAVLIPAWYGKRRMQRLLYPLVASEVTLTLYGPEENWFRSLAEGRDRERSVARALVRQRSSYRSLGRKDRTEPLPAVPPRFPLMDPDLVVMKGRRAQVKQCLDVESDEGVAACLYYFAGDYWAAFTPSHRIVQLVGDDSGGDRSKDRLVERVASDVGPGDLLLLVRGSDRDAIRQAVDGVAPEGLREQAAEWRRALERAVLSGRSFSELQVALRHEGCSRAESTLRGWVVNEAIIGPQSGASDVEAILRVTKDRQLADNLEECVVAIENLWRLHAQCGHRLRLEVIKRASAYLKAGAPPDELVEIEESVVLVAVESVDRDLMTVPRGMVNRLHEGSWLG